MKKFFNAALVFVFVIGIVLAYVPASAEAVKPIIPLDTTLAGGTWNTGTEVDVDLTVVPAPGWTQLLAKGVKLEGATKICHHFRGGQFGWKADIRQLKNGKWIKVATTQGWVPTTEGQYMACAQAPAAGTYALFGYYQKPATPKETCNYDTSGWGLFTTYNSDDDKFYMWFDAGMFSIPANTLVTYQLLTTSPNLTIAPSGSAISYQEAVFIRADFLDNPFDWTSDFSVMIRVSAAGCTKDIQFVNWES